MATSVVQGTAASAQACITAMEAAMDGLTISNTYAQGIVKEGSVTWRYYFIYN
jgi:hypothetical protein